MKISTLIWSLSSFFKKWTAFKQTEGIHSENTARGCVRARQRNTEGVNAPISWKSIYWGGGDFKPLDVSSLQSTVVGVCVCVCLHVVYVCVSSVEGTRLGISLLPNLPF